MIIGMRGHDFGRMEPPALAEKIASYGFRATQLAFGKAFPQSAETYMTKEALHSIFVYLSWAATSARATVTMQ